VHRKLKYAVTITDFAVLQNFSKNIWNEIYAKAKINCPENFAKWENEHFCFNPSLDLPM
jgi:hypothetical protein